jgi:hypothetical protein
MAVTTWAKSELTGAADGKGIKVVAIATAGTLIHTAGAVTGDDNYDEIYLDCSNSDVVERELTLEWGGVAAPDNNLFHRIPARSTIRVVGGLVLQNSLVARAFADVANVLSIHGFVNKIRNS